MTQLLAELEVVAEDEGRDAEPPTREVVRDFTIDELRTGGWSGRATVELKRHRGGQATPGAVWAAVGQRGLVPGVGVVLRVKLGGEEGEEGEDGIVRTWPSVLTGFQAVAEGSGWMGELEFCDPLTYFAASPIWGVFRDAAPGEIVGGALTLAAGVADRPTLTPVVGSLPLMSIKQQGRRAVERLPYALAAGEPLGVWLWRWGSSLGLQLEVLGQRTGRLQITVRDGRQPLAPVCLEVGEGEATTPRPVSARHATVNALRLSAHLPVRGAVLDNQVTGDMRHLGVAGPVESVWTAAELEVEEASRRAAYQGEKGSLQLASLKIVSAQPGLLPGRLVKFTNQSILGAVQWQVVNVTHLFSQRRLRNIAVLAKDGYPVRGPRVDDEGPLTVSAVIDDGSSAPGTLIARDRLGRIPVRFLYGFIPGAEPGAGENGAGGASGGTRPPPPSNGAERPGWSAVIPLPVVEPMAGAQHGFVPTHRQGDLCRVAVQSPTYAEIVGFVYGENRKVGLDVSAASAGLVVRQQTGEWQGFGFWPDEALDEAFQEGDDE